MGWVHSRCTLILRIADSSRCHSRVRIDVVGDVTASEHGRRCDPEYNTLCAHQDLAKLNNIFLISIVAPEKVPLLVHRFHVTSYGELCSCLPVIINIQVPKYTGMSQGSTRGTKHGFIVNPAQYPSSRHNQSKELGLEGKMKSQATAPRDV